MRLNAGYVFDESVKRRANREGRNYWWAYMAEVLSCLGLVATPISPEKITEYLAKTSLLFLDDMDASPFLKEFEKWVKKGGTLVGCNTEGLDRIFGNKFSLIKEQQGDEFNISGYFQLTKNRFTTDIRSPLHPEKPLIVVSRLRLVKSITSIEIGTDGENSYITAKPYGKGWAFYFCFNIAQTFWTIQQGRPIDRDYDGDGYWRTSDASIIKDNEPEIAYTDELLFLLQNIVSIQPFPLIHQLPPKDGKIPDCVLHYAGDDEGESGIQVPAAEFMASRGLPYHINIMPKNGRFTISPEVGEELKKKGTELSLHLNFMDGFIHPGGFTEDDVKQQVSLYERIFGTVPVCANTHWWRWCGWAEPALWMMKTGIKADNSFAHRRSPPLDPRNLIGFSFGTAFPHFFWSDFKNGNERIDFLELPVVAYEVGYTYDSSSSRDGFEKYEVDINQLEKVILLAKHYNMIMCIFYHPVYLVQVPSCRRSVDELLSILREKGIEALHLGTNEIVRWWRSRCMVRVNDATFKDGVLKFRSSCPYPEGFIAKISIGDLEPIGLEFRSKVENKFGNRWLLLLIPSGENEITIHLRRSNKSCDKIQF